jgi:hypothetical protein
VDLGQPQDRKTRISDHIGTTHTDTASQPGLLPGMCPKTSFNNGFMMDDLDRWEEMNSDMRLRHVQAAREAEDLLVVKSIKAKPSSLYPYYRTLPLYLQEM